MNEERTLEEQIADLQEEIDSDEFLRGTSDFIHVADRLDENYEAMELLKSYLT